MDDRLWEHQEAGAIVDALMERLMESETQSALLDPLWEELSADLENRPPHAADPEIDARVDHIIARSPALYGQFQAFVEAAFRAGPGGDGRPPHFDVPASPPRPAPPGS